MREIGQGVKGSPVAAYYWYSMAQRQGHEQAGERLLNLRSTMTTEEVNKAEDLLRQHDAGQRNATQQ
jgi:TPR repeat protein